jgi:hypothetical protein
MAKTTRQKFPRTNKLDDLRYEIVAWLGSQKTEGVWTSDLEWAARQADQLIEALEILKGVLNDERRGE